MQEICHVVIHTPGPRWIVGRSPFEQEGLQHHLAHYRQWLTAGKLALGGPFLDAAAGGMMIPVPGVDAAEIVAFADADPAVASGLLKVEVRAWLVGMKAG